MTFIAERLSLEKLKFVTDLKSLEKLNLPPSPARDLLAYLHSGDVLRHSLPRFLRIGAVVWLFLFVLMWTASWPGIYEEFERWGLVKAFFARMISLFAACVVFRITMLRAEHLKILPPGDFVNLRAFAMICRWLGEIVFIYALGSALSSLLHPVGATLVSILKSISPNTANKLSSGTPLALLLSAPFSILFVLVAAALFLVLYAIATATEVYLAIEFNTRAEKTGKGISLGGL